MPWSPISEEDNLTDKKIAELRKKIFKDWIDLCFELLKNVMLNLLILFVLYRTLTHVEAEGVFETYVRLGVYVGSVLAWTIWVVEFGAWIKEKRRKS